MALTIPFGLLPCLQDGKIYTFEELSESSAALISQRHAEMRDAGKEIGKLLSTINRVLKVGSSELARLLAHEPEVIVHTQYHTPCSILVCVLDHTSQPATLRIFSSCKSWLWHGVGCVVHRSARHPHAGRRM